MWYTATRRLVWCSLEIPFLVFGRLVKQLLSRDSVWRDTLRFLYWSIELDGFRTVTFGLQKSIRLSLATPGKQLLFYYRLSYAMFQQYWQAVAAVNLFAMYISKHFDSFPVWVDWRYCIYNVLLPIYTPCKPALLMVFSGTANGILLMEQIKSPQWWLSYNFGSG